MKPKIAEEVHADDWALFEQVKTIINSLPDYIECRTYLMGALLPRHMAVSHYIPDCHTVTRALAKFLPVDVHDGIIGESKGEGKPTAHWHSWLTRKGSDGRAIIDPWPLGSVSGPALFIQDYAFHFGCEQTFLLTRTEEFRIRLAFTRFAIRKVIKAKFPDL